LKAVKR